MVLNVAAVEEARVWKQLEQLTLEESSGASEAVVSLQEPFGQSAAGSLKHEAVYRVGIATHLGPGLKSPAAVVAWSMASMSPHSSFHIPHAP